MRSQIYELIYYASWTRICYQVMLNLSCQYVRLLFCNLSQVYERAQRPPERTFSKPRASIHEIFHKNTARVTNKDADEIEDPYVQFYYYLDQMLAHLFTLVHIPLLTNSF